MRLAVKMAWGLHLKRTELEGGEWVDLYELTDGTMYAGEVV